MSTFTAEFENRFRENDELLWLARAIILPEAAESQSQIINHKLLETVSEWSFSEESHAVGNVATSVASAFTGEEFVGKQEILKQTAKLKGVAVAEVNDIATDSGFPRLFQISSGLTDEQYLFIEMLVAQALCTKSLKNLGANNVPDLFLTSTSIPLQPYFEKHLARAIGITNMETVPTPYLKACDSTGSAFYDVLTGEYDDLLRQTCPQLAEGKPAVIILYSFEDGARLSHLGGDEYSAQVFSSGAAAWSFLYHPDRPDLCTFKHVVGKQKSVKKGAECLRYIDTTKDWPQDATDPNKMAPHMTEPEEGVVQMDPKLTPVFFKKHGIALAKEVWQLFKSHIEQQKGNELTNEEISAKIKRVIVHHPSRTIFNHVRRAFVGRKNKEGLGFTKEQIQWVISEGNAPVTTIPIAFGRQLEDLDPEDYIMFLSYGAGGGFTCQVVQVNQYKLEESIAKSNS